MPNILRHLSKSVLNALEVLNENNYEAYVVGGAVRDALLERPIHDFDICTNAKPQTVKTLFECYDYKTVDTGIKHGTVTVIKNNVSFEITTYRSEGKYLDNRHPESVTYCKTLKEDLSRRDFTINALACDKTGKVIDLYNGIDDLNNKIIRTVGKASDRLKEDALRIYRAIRFSKVLGFTVDQELKEAILDNKELVKNLSIERVNSEMEKMLNYDFKDTYLEYKDVLVIPYEYNHDLDNSEINLINNFPDCLMKVAYFLSLLDINSYLKTINIIKLSNDSKKTIKMYVDNIRSNEIKEEKDFTKIYLKKTLSKYGLNDGYYLIQLLCYINNIDILIVKETIDSIKEDVISLNGLNIDGNDLMEIGFSGKEIGKCENELLELVLIGKVKNEKNALIKSAQKIYKKLKK